MTHISGTKYGQKFAQKGIKNVCLITYYKKSLSVNNLAYLDKSFWLDGRRLHGHGCAVKAAWWMAFGVTWSLGWKFPATWRRSFRIGSSKTTEETLSLFCCGGWGERGWCAHASLYGSRRRCCQFLHLKKKYILRSTENMAIFRFYILFNFLPKIFYLAN